MTHATGPLAFSIPTFPYDRWGSTDAILTACRRAEALGFTAVALPDHVVMPVRPGTRPVSEVWYDPLVLATHLAAGTSRLRVLLQVLVVPYRPPVQTAKAIATLDVVSGGRVTVGVGAGHLRGEFRVLGIPRRLRGLLTDEYLDAMIALWTQDEPRFGGDHVSFRDVAFRPTCEQQPHVPLWIGGSGPRPRARVARVGAGWMPLVGGLDELRREVVRIREQTADAGRDPSALTFTINLPFGPEDPDHAVAVAHTDRDRGMGRSPAGRRPHTPGEVRARVERCAAAGFTHFVLNFTWRDPADYLDRLEWFHHEVMRPLGAAATTS